jgi:hypothetical protein
MAELNLQVGASPDDAQRYLTIDQFDLICTEFMAGAFSGIYNKYGTGARFTNITIPQGATINQAYLTLRCSFGTSAVTVNTRISAEKIDNAPTFADDKAAFDTRYANRTTARVDWDSIPAWSLNVDYNSPEIKTVIQEIINRAGWASGNALVIFWEDFDGRSTNIANCGKRAYSYNGSTPYAPRLYILYTPAETAISSQANYPLGWTPGKELQASLTSQKTWPLGWTPAKALDAALTSQANYPLGWTPGKELGAATASEKSYPLGWTPAKALDAALSSQKSWLLGWTGYVSKGVISWKGLTDTLIAAQKNPHRTPYVEAKVYDFEQGIKRLTWTSLYTGSEPDNHHGIAFDGQGSMHRIRAAASNLLYYQKITNPGPSSDFSQWTQIAIDCAGPCAIAAYGAKVYIFYRTTGNDLWKYYSYDYGQSWYNAQLAAIANVLSMAAAWKGTTSTVVCFAATAIKISAIVLDTDTQVATEYYYNHALDTTYGIGATFRDGEFPIILAAKDTDSGTGIVTYSIYATRLSAAYNFLALRVLLSAQEDVSTLFQYPDCHSPASPYSHESLQLTAVESYAGVTAYDRPLLAHLVKDTDWSSAVITEPRFFLNVSSLYGVRLMTDGSYWWLSKPDGVWRAPRPAEPPIDLTPYLQQLRQLIRPDAPGSLALELDNSKGQFASPGTGALASLQKRSEVVLNLGYRTTAGPEFAASLHYWIDGWDYRSDPNTSVFVLRCTDLWGLAFAWSARYSLRWNYTAFQPCRVWEILYQLLGRFGIRLWNNGGVPQSDPMNNYYPKFLSRGGTNAATQLRRLLDFVTDGLVPREALCFAKDLLANETPGYEYKNQPGFHPILKGEYGDNLTITHAQVSGETEEVPPTPVRESAFDWDNLLRGIDTLAMEYDPNLEETDQAAKRAVALLRHEAQKSLGGQITVPTNCGQELYDVISVNDPRVPLGSKNYRVLAIQTDYDRRSGRYEQKLALGAP